MTSITVRTPTVGIEAYFTFKEPFNSFIGNRFNITVENMRLRVISIIAMRDVIRTDLRDPYTDLYDPAGLTEVQYKLDLNNDVPLISLSFKTPDNIERYIRVPLNYISTISDDSLVEYMNRIMVVDLGNLPRDFDLDVYYEDFKDYIASRVGVNPEIKDVTLGGVEFMSHDEHELRETVRSNTVTVHKTISVQLAEITEAHDELLNRLETLGIALG